MGYKDPRLGQIVYILVFYNISSSWFPPLDGFQFIFSLHDSENDLFRQSIPMPLLTQFSLRPLMSQHWKVCLNQIVTELLQIVMDVVYP